ncbi:MAG: DNA primase DnaG [Candidatus Micrarchaeota archaeon]|nr:DNA primase DnaG [Candidatus Micrarchaeota archaeon]
MGKIYIDTIKYMVYADFEIKGLVEKPDVVGAIFGQTEGLLGDELDLREMQKSGRIGRIEVELTPRDGKSIGKILLPSSLDMVETSVIAAAIESVDRVGPCEARISVSKIEDMRSVKRKQLVSRAKSLLKTLVTETLPESKEILDMVRDEVKASGVVEYGPERLVAGPEIDTYDSIIVVEGRADVINLLKNDIKNVIALGGASVPKTIIELSKKKEITLFLDGDRGGDIILKEMLAVADVDFVARAPPGTEVEELSRKELIKALRSKVPVEQAESQFYGRTKRPPSRDFRERNKRLGEDDMDVQAERAPYKRPAYEPQEQYAVRSEPKRQPFVPDTQPDETHVERPAERLEKREFERPQRYERAEPALAEKAEVQEPAQPVQAEMPPELKSHLDELNGTLRARLLGEGNELIKELPVRDLITELNSSETAPASIVLDGIITQRLLDLAASKKIRSIAGIKVGSITKRPATVAIFTSQH